VVSVALFLLLVESHYWRVTFQEREAPWFDLARVLTDATVRNMNSRLRGHMLRTSPIINGTEDYRELRVLEEIEHNPNVSQRELAGSVDVALGVVNACVRTLTRKGMLKVRGESNRSVTYHLTKKGLLHKAMLAMEWTSNTIDFYRQVRGQIDELLGTLIERGVSRIGLYGADESAELVTMLAAGRGLSVAAIAGTDRTCIAKEILGVRVGDVEGLTAASIDAVIICVDLRGDETTGVKRTLAQAGIEVPVFTLSGQEL